MIKQANMVRNSGSPKIYDKLHNSPQWSSVSDTKL